jgi:hypothetical protein
MRAENVFRSANDRIAEKGGELGWQFRVPFLCECSDPHCFTRIELTLEEFAQVRSHSERYLTVPGHEVVGASLIEDKEAFAVAEKPTQAADSNVGIG